MNWERAIIFLDGIIEKLRRRSGKVSEFWLKAIGQRLRKLKGLDPSDAAGIAAIRNDTKLLSDLEDAMRAAGADTVKDAKALLKTAARLSADAAPVAQDLAMEEWISGVAEATQGTLQNIARTSTVAVVSPNGVVSPGEAYVRAVDEVAAQLAGGEDGLRRATRKVCEQFADAGLSMVEYESGRVEELGAATERNLKQAVHEVYQGVQRRVGQEYGADGVEISAHADCAPDHLDVQGMQFTNEEYEQVNGALRRKIGTWNCRHVIYSIIVGVTPPTYTPEELAEMRARSMEKVEFDGKEMTRYEATQAQRRLEREIRRQKNRAIIAKEAGEDEMRREAQMKIDQLTDKYKELSDAFGLKTQAGRMSVSGYRPVKVEAENSDGAFGEKGKNIQSDFPASERESLRKRFPDVKNLSEEVPDDNIERELGPKKEMTFDEVVSGGNKKNYENDQTGFAYSMNCQRVGVEFEMRCRGHNVVAKPYQESNDPFRNNWKKMYAKIPDQKPTLRGNGEKEAIDLLTKWGSGSRASIRARIKSLDGLEETPHVFEALNIDGKILFIDEQDGLIDAKILFSRIIPGSAGIIRTDNATFNYWLFDCVEAKK